MIGRRRSVRISLIGAALGLVVGCVNSPLRWVGSEDRDRSHFEHVKIGYRISYPDLPAEERWSAASLEGADLAFRGPRGDQMGMLSECRATDAEVNLLSRNLALGFRDQKLLASRPVAVGGLSGWERVFETATLGRIARVKTVTVRAGGCTFDWLLVSAPGLRFVALEPTFDRWVASFEAPPAKGSDGGGGDG